MTSTAIMWARLDADYKPKKGQMIRLGRGVDQKALIADSFAESLNELIVKLRTADWSFADKNRGGEVELSGTRGRPLRLPKLTAIGDDRGPLRVHGRAVVFAA